MIQSEQHHKKCGKCKEIKELSLFSKNRTRQDNYDSTCKKCCAIIRENNKEILSAKYKEYYQKTKVQRNIKLQTKQVEDLVLYTYKNIPGIDDYICTTCGKIYSYKSNKWLKSTIRKDGYLSIAVCTGGKQKSYLIHRIVALTFIDNPYKYDIVNHIDEVKSNNDVSNLEWVSQSKNMEKYFANKFIITRPTNLISNDTLEKYQPLHGIQNYGISRQGKIINLSTLSIIRSYDKNGYLCIQLNGKTFAIHRLVALTYIPNPNNCDFVNHIDGNKTNNIVENLEWVTRQSNQNHAYETGLVIPYTKKIIQKKDGIILHKFDSIKQAAQYNNCHRNCVSDVCRGIRNIWYGYTFEYQNMDLNL